MTPVELPILLNDRYNRIMVNKMATAPLTIPPPAYMFAIDYNEFAKQPGEKEILIELKKGLPKTRNYKFVTVSKFCL